MCSGWDGRARRASLSVVPQSVKRHGRTIRAEGIADGVRGRDTGRDEVVQVVPPAVLLDLEVAGVAADPGGELRRDAPPEMLELIRRRIPRREDRRTEPLGMPVQVARDRADVVGGGDPSTAAIQAAQDDDHPEMRQLVVSEAHGWATEGVEDIVERIGVDGRGKAVADRGGAHGDPCRLAPGVGRQVVRQLVGEKDRPLRTDGVAMLGSSRDARPAELRRLRKPGERLRFAGQLDDRDRRRHEGQERAEERRLAHALWSGGHDDRDAGLDQKPELGGELRVERSEPEISSTIDRGSGGSGRKAQRSRAGEKSAIARSVRGGSGTVKRFAGRLSSAWGPVARCQRKDGDLKIPRLRRRWVVILGVVVVVLATLRLLDQPLALESYRLADPQTVVVTGYGTTSAWTHVTGIAESEATVTISVNSFEITGFLPHTNEADRIEIEVRLNAPLGGRDVLDGSTGLSIPESAT